MKDYGPNVWQAMIRQASDLPDADIKRHASVSRDNRHRCYSCFTCACLTVAEQRKLFRKPIRRDTDV
jgi:hypothetical protein